MNTASKGNAPRTRERTRIRFWGVRGSIPTPGPTTVHYGGNTSCVEIRADGQIIVLDAGTGLRLLGRELVAEFDRRPLAVTLLLTHTHWDHIQGLPFFMPVYKPQNQVRILGYEGARHGLEVVLTGQMASPFFPVGLPELPASVQIEELKRRSFNIGPVRVQAFAAHHPGKCVGYRLATSAGTVAFFPDNEVHPTKALNRPMVDFLRGTDVAIMDTQFDAQEYQQHTGWGHGCLDAVVALALQARVKTLFLFHHDPNHDDRKIASMLAHARRLVAGHKSALRVEAAREGMSVVLPAAVRR
jgi:phosphoribosyl 1,2-cyclic phosphodiesterase